MLTFIEKILPNLSINLCHFPSCQTAGGQYWAKIPWFQKGTYKFRLKYFSLLLIFTNKTKKYPNFKLEKEQLIHNPYSAYNIPNSSYYGTVKLTILIFTFLLFLIEENGSYQELFQNGKMLILAKVIVFLNR